MAIPAINSTQPRKRNYTAPVTTVLLGAATGAGARYVLPTSDEVRGIVNKQAVNQFVSNASTVARGANRSVLKYSGIGAAVGGVMVLLSKIFPKNDYSDSQYTKLGTLTDASVDACAIDWFGDSEF